MSLSIGSGNKGGSGGGGGFNFEGGSPRGSKGLLLGGGGGVGVRRRGFFRWGFWSCILP
jgi:hypothetical protein